MKLRPYQERSLDLSREQYAQGKRSVLLCLATGAGKTVVASAAVSGSTAKGLTSLFVVPRLELMDQTIRTLALTGITDLRTIQAQNDNGNPNAKVIVASMQTLTLERWMHEPIKADFVVIDECHHGAARTHEAFIKQYPSAKILGLSATPQRGDGRGLQDLFDALVVGATVKELTDLGALVPCKVYAPPRIMDSRELAQDPVDAYEQRTAGQKAIVFCSTVEHAQRTAAEFQARGHRARWISGESRDREEIIQQFSTRSFDVLVSVNLFIEGFDDPGTEVAIMARRFTHVGSWLQAIGRILRPYEGKTLATVVDLCGSALVHGTPDLERTYSLAGKGISTQRQPIRRCQNPLCSAVFVSASAQACPYCEFKLPVLTRQQKKALGIPLEEVDRVSPKTSWPMRAKTYGRCAGCSKTIVPGTWILYSRVERKAMHTGCAAMTKAAA